MYLGSTMGAGAAVVFFIIRPFLRRDVPGGRALGRWLPLWTGFWLTMGLRSVLHYAETSPAALRADPYLLTAATAMWAGWGTALGRRGWFFVAVGLFAVWVWWFYPAPGAAERSVSTLMGLALCVGVSGARRPLAVVWGAVFLARLWDVPGQWLYSPDWDAAVWILPAWEIGARARTVVAFGKTGRVMRQALVVMAAAVLAALGYAGLLPWTRSILPGDAPSGLLALLVLAAIFAVLWALWTRFQARLEPAFTPASAKRLRELAEFTVGAPRFVHSPEVVRAAEQAVSRAVLCPQVRVYFPGERDGVFLPAFAQGDAIELPPGAVPQMFRRQTFWAKQKIFSDFELQPEPNAELIFPLRLAPDTYGLLWLGPKSRGRYNLEEIEAVRSAAQAVALTLEVLTLLEREKKLVEQTMEANLAALRAQINPHFLFNTFNSISELIHHAPERAEKALEKLAFIFRYTLKFSKDNHVSLRNEMRLVQSYLDIEQIRFGERVKISVEIEEKALDMAVPAFVLQTIVENCFKHGVSKVVRDGRVELKARLSQGRLVVEVYDNGPGADASRLRSGTGIKNVFARLETLYGRDAELRYENLSPGTRVVLSLPAVEFQEA
ncbi:MAG: histidine kinase [Bacteroidia bacterium]|nr:histidine kinase [Bacteroidia bacterium]